jgi:hypothetical protein
MMREAQEILDFLPQKRLDEKAFNKIVEDRNWKFKEFKDYKKNKNNQYQWKELYEQIDYCDKYDLLSYMSQFAHGLSMSNLVINLNAQNCDSVIAEALGLLDRMYVYVMEFFSLLNRSYLRLLSSNDKMILLYPFIRNAANTSAAMMATHITTNPLNMGR